jgi:uncharacterized membrane protein YesL
MIALTLIWIVSWFTIVLGPPTTFGVYYVIRQILSRESPGLRALIDGSKIYFLKSWAWMLTNLVLAYILYANQAFYGQIENSWAEVFKIASLAVYLLWLVLQFYTLPYLILQEKKSLFQAWRNGLFTVLAYPIYTFVLILLTVLILVISILTIIPVLLGMPVLVVFIGSQAVTERVSNLNLSDQDS